MTTLRFQFKTMVNNLTVKLLNVLLNLLKNVCKKNFYERTIKSLCYNNI